MAGFLVPTSKCHQNYPLKVFSIYFFYLYLSPLVLIQNQTQESGRRREAPPPAFGFYVLIHLATAIVTALCAVIKPRKLFESAASRHFQKVFCNTQSLNRLYHEKELLESIIK